MNYLGAGWRTMVGGYSGGPYLWSMSMVIALGGSVQLWKVTQA